jgi:hypothetical protein
MFGSATHWENHSDAEVWFCSFCIFTVKMPLDVKFKIGILFEAQSENNKIWFAMAVSDTC